MNVQPANEDWLSGISAEPGASESIAVGWKKRILIGKRGAVLTVVANAIIALRNAPDWQGVLHFNESSMMTVAKNAPPFEVTPNVPFNWGDEHDILAAAWLQHQGINVNKDIASQAVHTVAREHSFHPVRAYLDSLVWDGVARIDDWLSTYLGVQGSEYTRAAGAKFLIGGVARVYQPGCKNDTCLILEGPQGAMKSTALRTLASDEFFSDDISDLGSKDSVMQTRGMWIIELSELDAMARTEASRAKAYMSRQVDRIRPPYGKRVVEAPRECVFAGTVNKDTYLKDETGGRRFWPVRCGAIQIPDLKRDRDQLWAEARSRFRSGENWWMDGDALVKSAAEEASARYEGDPWDELIATWVRKPTVHRDPAGCPVAAMVSTTEFVTIADVLTHCIRKAVGAWTQKDQNRVAQCLVSKGWKRKQKRFEGEREWVYFSPSPVSPLQP